MTNADASRALGNLVIPTDFSPGARLALERAALLPVRRGATLHVLHVVSDAHDPRVADRMTGAAQEWLGDARQELFGMLAAAGTTEREVVVTIGHGKPFVEVVRSAHHGRAELVVIGRHGHRTFRDLLIGSTAERVIRKGDVSVLVVATAADKPYQRPLVAVDLGDSARLALELAARIADPAGEPIEVLHVVELPITHAAGAEAALGLVPLRLEREERARLELAAFLDQAGVASRCNLVIRTGDPRQVILDEARARGSDLIALGTHGRTGLTHALLGSVAEGVLRSAAVDVLVARLPRTDVELR